MVFNFFVVVDVVLCVVCLVFFYFVWVQENFCTRNQLSALGSAMVQDATLLENDIHHVEEDLVTNVKERLQENDRLREIQRMLLSGNTIRAAAGGVVVGGQTHKGLYEGGVSSLLESKSHY